MKLARKHRHFLKDLLRCATFSIFHYPFSIDTNKSLFIAQGEWLQAKGEYVKRIGKYE